MGITGEQFEEALRREEENERADTQNHIDNTDRPPCVNWMMYEAVRETVADYDKTWGGGDMEHDLSDFNITRNCMACNMRPPLPPGINTLTEVADIFKEPVMKRLEEVGMIRKCYKGK